MKQSNYLTKHIDYLDNRAEMWEDSQLDIKVLKVNGKIHSYHYPSADLIRFCRHLGVSTQHCSAFLASPKDL